MANWTHPNKKRGITITTDASYINDSESTFLGAGYAFDIVCDSFRIRKGGKFKTQIADILDAETYAIGNAFAALLCHWDTCSYFWVVINTDSLNAISNIQHGKRESGRAVMQLLKKLRLKMKTQHKHIEFRHVKAHTKTDDARSVVNRWADSEAKKWAREQMRETRLKNKQ